MGDIIELLEKISCGKTLSASEKVSNLFDYLLDKEYIGVRSDTRADGSVRITEKGLTYLNALYLLRLEQTPNNFVDRGDTKAIINNLEQSNYIEIETSPRGVSMFNITQQGREVLSSLKAKDI